MNLKPALRWQLDADDVDPLLLSLLRYVAGSGSLSAAVRKAGLSYRHAWGMLGRIEQRLGSALVKLERGRGASLTRLGAKLIEADAALQKELAPRLARAAALLDRPRTAREKPAGAPVIIHASHDMALAQLHDIVATTSPLRIELHFMGSLDCLDALARKRCDIAGFHVPEPVTGSIAAAFRPMLRLRTLQLVPWATRQQGLMVARENPLRIRTLADLVRKGIRFVNRQTGSGTLLTFDHLLAEEGLPPARIQGYRLEEFTHAAVAATIATGMADAGFGIEAAARQHGLAFVPVVQERYMLAARNSTLLRPGPSAWIATLHGPAARKILKSLPGYTLPVSNDAFSPRDVFN